MVRGNHGHSRKGQQTPEYISWASMRNRCEHPKHKDWHRYGGRGITVCDRWVNGEGGLAGFECFLADMGLKPGRSYTLDRIDNDRGYEPGNCRWATAEQQRLNRSVTVRVDGKTLAEIAADAGLALKTVKARYYQGDKSLARLSRPKDNPLDFLKLRHRPESTVTRNPRP